MGEGSLRHRWRGHTLYFPWLSNFTFSRSNRRDHTCPLTCAVYLLAHLQERRGLKTGTCDTQHDGVRLIKKMLRRSWLLLDLDWCLHVVWECLVHPVGSWGRMAREAPGDPGKLPSGSRCSGLYLLTATVFTPVPQHLHPLSGSPDLLGSLLEKGT